MLRGQLSPVCRVSTRKPLHNTLLVRGYSIVRGTHCLVLECWPFTGKGSENRYIRFVPTAQRTVTVRLFRTKRYVLTLQWTIPQPVPRAAVIYIVTLLSAFVRAAKTSLTSPSTCPFFKNVFIFYFIISAAHTFSSIVITMVCICPRIVFVRG